VSDLLGRLRAAWDNLSPRERILLSAAAGILGVAVLVLGIASPLIAATDGARSRAESAGRQLDQMIRLRNEYDEIRSRVDAVERRIRDSNSGSNTLTFLESLARRANVTIDSMEERKASTNERYKETRVEVSLSSVTLRDTMDFLHQIESAKQQFSVKKLRIKRRSDDSQLLNVNFSVSSFEPVRA
jgi:type II secretory pathway component PulM